MLKTCPKGHQFNKTGDCPVCPECENERKPRIGWQSRLSAPARRALENQGITDLSILAQYSERDILKLHGIGPTAIPVLKESLLEEGLNFKNLNNQNSKPKP